MSNLLNKDKFAVGDLIIAPYASAFGTWGYCIVIESYSSSFFPKAELYVVFSTELGRPKKIPKHVVDRLFTYPD